MKPHQHRMCPVIQRMVGDMKLRNKAQATIDAHTYHVQRFAPSGQAAPAGHAGDEKGLGLIDSEAGQRG